MSSVVEESKVWMTYGRNFQRRGESLMHQQCGLWGYDVRREVGGVRQNLLLELGFQRTPPPDGVVAATQYRRCEKCGAQVTLWGFGMRYGDEQGGIFLSRFTFQPRLGQSAHDSHCWEPKSVKESHRPPGRLEECGATLHYFENALCWIAKYEREVTALCGVSYREKALGYWGSAVLQDIPQQWEQLAGRVKNETRLWRRQGKSRVELPLETTLSYFGPASTTQLRPALLAL